MFGDFVKYAKRVMIPLALIAMLGLGVAHAQDDTTPELTPDTTPELTPGEPLAGVLTRQPDTAAQVYTFEGTAGENIRLLATSTDGLALALLLTDASGNFVAEARDAGATGQATLEATLGATGTYYVTVLPVVGVVDNLSQGTYALVLESNVAIAGEDVTAEATEVPLAAVSPTPDVSPTPEVTTAPAVEATIEVGQVAVLNGGMQVVLTWNAAVDLDLEVRDPVGGALYFNNPVIDFGGTFGNNVNAGCQAIVSNNATEQAAWSAGGVPVGSYEILVYYQADCGGVGPVDFTLDVTVDGQPLETITGRFQLEDVFLANYELALDGTAQMRDLFGVRSNDLLPASAAVLIQNAQPIQFGTPVQGVITNEQPYQSYSFDAPANDIISITMNANSGSLDPYIALIDPSGNVIYSNDDAAQGVTDSALTNSVLPLAGTYTIVASRYAQILGGTEGGYTLSLSGVLSGTVPTDATAATTTPLETATASGQALPESVTALQLPEGFIEITLVWNTAADLQLLVRDPAGDAVYDDVPQIRSGGRLGAAGNVNCTTSDTSPVSYVYWPTTITPRAGAYEIDVWFQSECNDTTPVSFTLYATVNNQPVITQTLSTSQPFLLADHYVTSFTINNDGTVVAGPGGISGIESLNWEAEAATAQNLLPGDAVSGSITPTNKFDLYAFDGLAGDVVTISMTAASGTNLDTKLYLIGPNGTVVTQNDDAVAGENTDSLINNFTLPEDGQYIIIATHYGDQYGITAGAYTLSLDL